MRGRKEMTKHMGNSSTYDYFMAALLDILNRGEMKQNEIASISGMASQSVNAYVNGRQTPGLSKQEAIAEACGYPYIEFIQMGQKIIEVPEPEPEPEPEQLPFVLPKKKTTSSVLSGVVELIERVNDDEQRLDFWRQTFEAVKDPIYLVRNGLVIRQNAASRAWCGGVLGQSVENRCLCFGCTEKDRKDCTIYKAVKAGIEVKSRKVKKGKDCLVHVTPIFNNLGVTIMVKTMVIEDYENWGKV
jgi:transcriptional regulator with XRE-family HTH domain